MRMRWARLRVDLNVRLRRGAWYPIEDVGPLEALISVNRSTLPVPCAFLQIVENPPRRWTVVARPDNAVRIPDDWKRYAVCPRCQTRAQLVRRVPSIQCPRCRGTFDVDWGENYRLEI
jgi:hypothetical protein